MIITYRNPSRNTQTSFHIKPDKLKTTTNPSPPPPSSAPPPTRRRPPCQRKDTVSVASSASLAWRPPGCPSSGASARRPRPPHPRSRPHRPQRAPMTPRAPRSSRRRQWVRSSGRPGRVGQWRETGTGLGLRQGKGRRRQVAAPDSPAEVD